MSRRERKARLVPRPPSVDVLLRSDPARKGIEKFGRPLMKQALQQTLHSLTRSRASRSGSVDQTAILATALRAAARDYYGISQVINATGVVLHTGLGRAPLPERAVEAVTATARGYCDLEVERETGGRGRRTSRAEAMLTALTGAPAALVVNNNAAALVLSLAALARRREVLVSRGELIEIGGEFRLPDLMAASGAKLVEVGTTNRTRLEDYREALGPKTGLILKVHPSNYRVVGFVKSAGVRPLGALAREAQIPLLYDAGSGLLARYPRLPADEPTVKDCLAGGADLVTFSGDKLLGGPQAGLLVGKEHLVERLRRHPLARALRVDKMTVAALEAVFRLYSTGRRDEIPVWNLASIPQGSLLRRARAVASSLEGGIARKSQAVMGGGALPEYVLPSAEVVLPAAEPAVLAARLRQGRPSVFCRTEKGAIAFDLAAVPAAIDGELARAARYALEQG